MDDEWTIGSGDFPKAFLWSTYVTLNLTGSILCFLILLSLFCCLRTKQVAGYDVCIAALCSGCIVMGGACGFQCLLNLVSGTNTFQYGWSACWFEAFFHVAAIEMQFIGVTLIAGFNYFRVVHGTRINRVWVTSLVVVILWVLCLFSTYILGRFSRVGLLPTGAYCFYEFDSPVIKYQFTPSMVIALAAVIFFYTRIFVVIAKTERQVANLILGPTELKQPSPLSFGRQTTQPPSAAPNSPVLTVPSSHERRASASKADSPTRSPVPKTTQKHMAFAKSSIVFVAVFAIGWGPAVVACLYTVSTGSLTELLDFLLALCGSLHTVAVPLVYGYHSRRFRKWLFRMGCCATCWSEQLQLRHVGGDRGQPIVTVITRTRRIDVVPVAPRRSPRDQTPTKTVPHCPPVSAVTATPPKLFITVDAPPPPTRGPPSIVFVPTPLPAGSF